MYITFCCLATAILAGPMDLDDLIRRHEEGLGLIHSIKANIELRVSEDSGRTWKKILEHSVLRNGEYERRGYRAYLASTGGYPDAKIVAGHSVVDSLMTPEGGRLIQYAGLSPEDVPSGPIDVGELGSTGKGITGQIDPPKPFVPPLGYKSIWLVEILFLPDWRFGLKELCTDTHPRLSRGKNARGEPTYDIDVTDPTRLRRYALSLDPSHNYLITYRKEFEVPEVKGRPIEWFNNRTVVDFHEPRPGIFVPKTIRATSENIPGRIYEAVVSDVVVNEPFDDETLHHLEFPPGIAIFDATQEQITIYVWGDGKPALTFHSAGELDAWRFARMAAYKRRTQHPEGWRGKVVWIVVATLALGGILWIGRVVRRRLDPV